MRCLTEDRGNGMNFECAEGRSAGWPLVCPLWPQLIEGWSVKILMAFTTRSKHKGRPLQTLCTCQKGINNWLRSSAVAERVANQMVEKGQMAGARNWLQGLLLWFCGCYKFYINWKKKTTTKYPCVFILRWLPIPNSFRHSIFFPVNWRALGTEGGRPWSEDKIGLAGKMRRLITNRII